MTEDKARKIVDPFIEVFFGRSITEVRLEGNKIWDLAGKWSAEVSDAGKLSGIRVVSIA